MDGTGYSLYLTKYGIQDSHGDPVRILLCCPYVDPHGPIQAPTGPHTGAYGPLWVYMGPPGGLGETSQASRDQPRPGIPATAKS